jgi:hypothetical protein
MSLPNLEEMMFLRVVLTAAGSVSEKALGVTDFRLWRGHVEAQYIKMHNGDGDVDLKPEKSCKERTGRAGADSTNGRKSRQDEGHD